MRNGGIQIRVSDMLFILKKRWKTIVGLTLLGLVFGFVLSGMTYVQTSFQTFEITGSFAATTRNGEGALHQRVPCRDKQRLSPG